MAACHAADTPDTVNCFQVQPPLPAPPRAAEAAASSEDGQSTYHVRTDGGTANQCTGRADAPYPGSGSAQNCAWNSPLVALPASGSARISGGDTLMIGGGTYTIGSQMRAVPSGTSSARTRILGKSGSTPKLIGSNGIHRVLNLEGSSHVELGHLEVTDRSDCVYGHSNSNARCGSGDAWARVGLYASDSRNVWMHDVNIHGMAARGMQAGRLTDWTMERVKLNRNGTAGWDGNVGTNSSNAGNMTLRDIEISWNGCGERVSTGEPWACWAQQSGGYGDGLGLPASGGKWLIEDAFVLYNTSDGLDFYHMDGSPNSSVTLRRVYAAGNAGNQVKITGNSTVENSVLVGHCTYFKGKYNMTEGDICRAYGATVLLVLNGGHTATLRHNTLAGEGDGNITYSGSSGRIDILDNVVVGFPYYLDGSRRAFNAGRAPDTLNISGNLGWNLSSCPSGVSCRAQSSGIDIASIAPCAQLTGPGQR